LARRFAFRSAALGPRLRLRRARRLAEETGAAGLGLETATDNLPAQKLYEALGWRCDTAFYRYELKV
jgi:ribosomal protein S18 acetylase RimI-like enzyme